MNYSLQNDLSVAATAKYKEFVSEQGMNGSRTCQHISFYPFNILFCLDYPVFFFCAIRHFIHETMYYMRF